MTGFFNKYTEKKRYIAVFLGNILYKYFLIQNLFVLCQCVSVMSGVCFGDFGVRLVLSADSSLPCDHTSLQTWHYIYCIALY